jgi:hypothetical protein
MQRQSVQPTSANCPWILKAERDLSELAGSRVRVLYKEWRRALRKPLGKLQKVCILSI